MYALNILLLLQTLAIGNAAVWPKSEFPFKISPVSNEGWKDLIEKTLELISYSTYGCLKFQPHSAQDDYLHFQISTSVIRCSTQLGYYPGEHVIDLSSSCRTQGNITRLTLRALGLAYEHQRCDRDSFIRLNNNIEDSLDDIFAKSCTYNTSFDLPYDFTSIMHFSKLECRRAGATGAVIVPIQLNDITQGDMMGKYDTMSIYDATKLQLAYSCTPEKDEQLYLPEVQFIDTDLPLFFHGANWVDVGYKSVLHNATFIGKITADFASETDTHSDLAKITIYPSARSSDIKGFANVFRTSKFTRPIQLIIVRDRRERLKDELKNLKEFITDVKLEQMTGVSSAHITDMELPQIILIKFDYCKNVQLLRNDLASFPKLRALLAYETTFTTIQEGAFNGLIELQVLILDSGDSRRQDVMRQMRLFRCTTEYSWLKDWQDRMSYDKNIQLISKLNHLTPATISKDYYDNTASLATFRC